MQISFYKKNVTEASITIRVEEADYQDRVARKIQEYSKKTTIKGFRPGSVPNTLIQQMYGRSILMEEVNSLLSESLAQYLKENEIYVLGEPMLVSEKIDWENQRDFELDYMIGMAGKFSCELSKKMQVTAYKISCVAAQTVDDIIERLRRTHGTMEVVSQSTASDVIYGELYYPAKDFTVSTKIMVEEIAEKARTTFTNLSPQEKITLEVKQVFTQTTRLPGITEKMHKAMLSLGGSAEFTVERIHRLSPAVLEQEFFDKILGHESAKSEQEFREKLQKRVLQSKQEEANFHLEQSIQAMLLAETAIALPHDFLKDWLQQKNSTISKEEIDEYYPQYAKELQWGLLVTALSKEYSLQVTQEEIVEEVQLQFRANLENNAMAQPLLEESVVRLTQNFLQQDNGKYYKSMYDRLRTHKLISLVKDQITILTQVVSVEEFDRLASE